MQPSNSQFAKFSKIPLFIWKLSCHYRQQILPMFSLDGKLTNIHLKEMSVHQQVGMPAVWLHLEEGKHCWDCQRVWSTPAVSWFCSRHLRIQVCICSWLLPIWSHSIVKKINTPRRRPNERSCAPFTPWVVEIKPTAWSMLGKSPAESYPHPSREQSC